MIRESGVGRKRNQTARDNSPTHRPPNITFAEIDLKTPSFNDPDTEAFFPNIEGKGDNSGKRHLFRFQHFQRQISTF